MISSLRNIGITSMIFISCCLIGFTLAGHNPIENDESYTQHQSIQQLSFIDIFQGKVDEGNNCPLFYAVQKLFFSITHFELKTLWVMEQYVCQADAQQMLRVLPVMFMSGAIALCFYYCVRRFTYMAAGIAIALMLTTPMTWLYWAQDRPYGLWFLLTCAQTILITEYFLFKNQTVAFWRWMTVTHWLLCLCSGFGLLQTIMAALFIRKKWASVFLGPICVGLFYALHAPKYHFRIPSDWSSLITANLSADKMTLIGVYAIFLKNCRQLILWLLALLGLGALLIAAVYFQHTQGTQGFELSARYLLFLLPASAIILTAFWQQLMLRHGHDVWIKLALFQSVILILIIGGWRTILVLHRL